MNLRRGLCNARLAILHEMDYPWVARAIRGWPGSATGPEHSKAIHGSATGPEHIQSRTRLVDCPAGDLEVEYLLSRISYWEVGALASRGAVNCILAGCVPAVRIGVLSTEQVGLQEIRSIGRQASLRPSSPDCRPTVKSRAGQIRHNPHDELACVSI